MNEPKRPPLAAGPEDPVRGPVGSFQSFGDRLADERADRLAMRGQRLSFGVRYLDAALGGIFPRDLVLVGAKTGVGKTQLASIIALQNAAQGKRVHYFALEAEEREIERRVKFQVLSRKVRKHVTSAQAARMNFLDWYTGELDLLTAPYEDSVQEEVSKAFASLHTFYRTTDFYAEHFVEMVNQVAEETDLVILDHLHYVDSEDANENRGYKQIVKRIRDTALSLGKPVVVIAHLRKAERSRPRLMPDNDDFHGTSDVPKIATKSVMVARAEDQTSSDPAKWPTYVGVTKCRFDGARTRYVGLLQFDARTGLYDDQYAIGKVGWDKDSREDKWTELEGNDVPSWARQAPTNNAWSDR